MRTRRIIAGCASLAVTGLVIFLASCSQPVKAPKKGTEMRLQNVERAVKLLQEANHATIGEQLRGIRGEGTLQKKWELLLLDDAGRLEMEPREIRDFLCHDGWGNLFNVAFKTNLIAHGASATLLDANFDVVVWSSGRNGSNEFGHGDDVVFPTQSINR